MNGFERREKISITLFSELHEPKQAVGHTAAGRQNHRFARTLRCLDDVGDALKTTCIGNAGAAKFMYDPFIHD
jgi:hypothetical protein